ncbi:MAG TPA: hypothetical protein VKW06_09465 [Candidatus Angelobacter sp.]|nr:hypothetical protein [Candidatus Angelobacter sp.]
MRDSVPGAAGGEIITLFVLNNLRASRHPDHLRMLLSPAPKPQKHQVGLAKGDLLGTWIPVIEDMAIEQQMQLEDGNIEVTGGFGLSVELFHRL